MPMSRHCSRAKPSASISATRCERRKFFIRFCFRKLFSTSFVRSIRLSFVLLFFYFFSLRLLKYLVHARCSCATDWRACLSTLLPHEMMCLCIAFIAPALVLCRVLWFMDSVQALQALANQRQKIIFNLSQRHRDMAVGYCVCVTSYQRQHAVFRFFFFNFQVQ